MSNEPQKAPQPFDADVITNAINNTASTATKKEIAKSTVDKLFTKVEPKKFHALGDPTIMDALNETPTNQTKEINPVQEVKEVKEETPTPRKVIDSVDTIIDNDDALRATTAFGTLNKIAHKYTKIAQNEPEKLPFDDITKIIQLDHELATAFTELLKEHAMHIAGRSYEILHDIDDNNGHNLDSIVQPDELKAYEDLL